MDNRKRELKKKYAQEQRNTFANSLPFDITLFEKLLDYLDEMLGKDGCDHTLKQTTKFLDLNGLPVEKSIAWMKENDGFCDCEVLANIEDRILELRKDT